MKNKKFLNSVLVRSMLAAVVSTAVMCSAHAIDINPGDWTAPPSDGNLFLLYLQHAYSSTLHTNEKSTDNARINSNAFIFRYVRSIEVGGLVVAPQVLLPWANLGTGGVLSGLGRASGTGDFILASPVWLTKANVASRNSLAFAPYLVLPTEAYDKNRALNIGGNRWKAILQLGGTYQLSKRLDAESSINATVFGSNNQPEALGSDKLEENTPYQLQGSVNWHYSPSTLLATSVSHTFGGDQKLHSASLSNQVSTK